MKKIILITILISFTNLFSQIKEKNKTDQNIINKSAKFLLEKGDLESTENIDSKISIIEIVENKVLGYNEVGIYRLYSHKNPSFTYILLKRNSKINIVDLKDFSKSFKKTINFLASSDFEDDKKIVYLEKIIETYKNNNYKDKIRF